MSKTQWGKPLHYRRRRIWVVPLFWVLLAVVMGIFLARFDFWDVTPPFAVTITSGVEVPVLSSIASGMMALTAIVFSLTFVFVQFGSAAYSPRLVSLFTTDRVVTHSLGVFTGTFVFSLVGLMVMQPQRAPLLTWMVAAVALGWLFLSIAFFVLLVQRINHMTIANVLHVVGNAGRKVIESMYPLPADHSSPTQENGNLNPRPAPLPPVTQTLCYFGGPAVVVELHTHLLVHLARVEEALIEIEYAVGDVVADGSVVLRVRGAKKQISESALRNAIVLGLERTIEQDPKYALRLLVDVGIKALSPAVNDPTTAVMALNEIEDLVGRIGRRQLDVGYARDKGGAVRLVYPTPTWDDIVSLALDEIRFYGANSYQVMRRLRALLGDLEAIVLPERRAAIRQQVMRMEASTARTFSDVSDLNESQQSDRQGIGLSRTVP